MIPRPTLRVLRLNERATLPVRATEYASGLDLCATDDVVLKPGARELVPTGLAMEIPDGFEGQVRPRSGLAARNGVTVLNAPGTIDSDYRGEIRVLLVNLGHQPFAIHAGDRVAQLVICPVTRLEVTEVPELSPTARGGGGFGHTGT